MAQTTSDPPWLYLPAEISTALRPVVRDIVEAIIEGIPRDVPVYAMPMEGRFGQGVRQGVTVALHRFLDLPGTRLEALSPDGKWVYESLGRGGAVGAQSRVAARRLPLRRPRHLRAISRLVDVSQMPPTCCRSRSASRSSPTSTRSRPPAPRAMPRSSRSARASSSGCGRAARDAAARRLQRRWAARLAAAVGWTLPESVVAVALVPFPHVEGLRAGLGPDGLVAERAPTSSSSSPSPRVSGAAASIARCLRRAVVGPARPWQQAGESFRPRRRPGRWARPVPRPGRRPAATATVWVEDHLAELVVRAEPLATDDLARRRLAPLADLRPLVRARLTETLLSWLRHQGQRAPIAEELFVHQQTVGYRVAQLRQIFGDDLDDPEVRFELELVLRAGHR